MVTTTFPTTSSNLDRNLETFILIHPSATVGYALERLKFAPEKFAIIGESPSSLLTLVSQIHLEALSSHASEQRLEIVIHRLPPIFMIFSGVEMEDKRKLEWYSQVMSATAAPGLIVWDETISQIMGILPIEIIHERCDREFDSFGFDRYASRLVTNVGLAEERFKYLAGDAYKYLVADIRMCIFVCDANPPHLRIEVPDCSHPPNCPQHGLMYEL